MRMRILALSILCFLSQKTRSGRGCCWFLMRWHSWAFWAHREWIIEICRDQIWIFPFQHFRGLTDILATSCTTEAQTELLHFLLKGLCSFSVCWVLNNTLFVREAALFWIISNTVINFNLNYGFKMTLNVARWLMIGLEFCTRFSVMLISYWLRERGFFDPAMPHWQLVNSLGRHIPYSLLDGRQANCVLLLLLHYCTVGVSNYTIK